MASQKGAHTTMSIMTIERDKETRPSPPSERIPLRERLGRTRRGGGIEYCASVVNHFGELAPEFTHERCQQTLHKLEGVSEEDDLDLSSWASCSFGIERLFESGDPHDRRRAGNALLLLVTPLIHLDIRLEQSGIPVTRPVGAGHSEPLPDIPRLNRRCLCLEGTEQQVRYFHSLALMPYDRFVEAYGRLLGGKPPKTEGVARPVICGNEQGTPIIDLIHPARLQFDLDAEADQKAAEAEGRSAGVPPWNPFFDLVRTILITPYANLHTKGLSS
jgi:hypothetical protein